MLKRIILACLALVSPLASAGLISGSLDFTSTGVLSVDGGFAVPNTRSSSIALSDPGALVVSVGITANLTSSNSVINVDGTVPTCSDFACAHYPNELQLLLTSPDATTIELISFSTYLDFVPDSFVERADLVFDDAGAAQSGSMGPGTFAPTSGALSDFVGENATGNWTLTIADNFGSDWKSLNSWEIAITTNSSTVPEPTTLALLSLSLAGLGWSRRNRA